MKRCMAVMCAYEEDNFFTLSLQAERGLPVSQIPVACRAGRGGFADEDAGGQRAQERL